LPLILLSYSISCCRDQALMVFEDWNRNYNRVQSVPSKAEVKGRLKHLELLPNRRYQKTLSWLPLYQVLKEHCSGTKEPYDRREEGIPDQSQAAPVISLINPRTIPPHPRYVDGSDTIPRRGLRHDAVVRGPESEQTTVKGPGFPRTGFQEDGLSHRASFLNMKITPNLFEAYVKCPTKCWLRATNEPSAGAPYPEWVKAQNDSYRVNGTRRLVAEFPNDEVAPSPDMKNFKVAKWRLTSNLAVKAQMDCCTLESELHALERVPAGGRDKPAQFIPIRFVFTNKLDEDDKLVLAFDAFALSRSLGFEIGLGKIIHGDDHVALKVKTSALDQRSAEVSRVNHHSVVQIFAARPRFEPALCRVRLPAPLPSLGD
jgi:hypothetical protein